MNTLTRYGHTLPHQCQQTMRDLDAERINRDGLKGSALGYTLTDEQLRDREEGRHPGMPYRHLVRDPAMSSLPWRGFRTDEELQTWATAYGLTIARDGTANGAPEPGRTFQVYMPDEPVQSFAVVATDHPEVYAGPFATIEEASARMLELFPVVEPWDGVEVHVAVAPLHAPGQPYWRTAAEMGRG